MPNSKDKPKKKMGKPQLVIDWVKVEKLASIYCPVSDIAGIMGVSYNGLARGCKRKFKKTIEDWAHEKRGNTRAAVRNRQIQLALAGDKTMLIWLGKQMLGQSDRNRMSISGDANGAPVSIHVQKIEQMSQEERLAEIERYRRMREQTAGE